MALPIEAALPDLRLALQKAGRAVLQAPPGAGKTTRVPLFMLEEGLFEGKLILLEPRRLAARAAAERMAHSLREPVGQTVGYRVRGQTKTSPQTRIEVVTEGILTRMIQSDPGLEGVGCVIFDEFHERSLHADLGLALCLEVRGALREDLRLIVMSATLDAAPVAKLMDAAPLITSEGRSFPVETRWLPQPWAQSGRKGPRFEDLAARLVEQAFAENPEGAVLAFLPGAGEIARVEARLNLPKGVGVFPLFGAMPFAKQQAAIAPAMEGRKVVLATSIAETSLTIPDVRVVVDCGRARRARFDPGTGMSRLVTERVTRAEATQRQGRAGRVAPGMCYRLWAKAEEGALAAFPPAEIEVADLAALVLELAAWGAQSPQDIPFLSQPPEAAWAEAVALLKSLGALEADGAITPEGRDLAALPVHPRLGHMLLRAGAQAAPLAALIEARDPLPNDAPGDLSLRLEALKDSRAFRDRHSYRLNEAALSDIRAEAKRLRALSPKARADLSPGAMLSLAYPDRIAQRRAPDAPRYLMASGKGAILGPGDQALAAPILIAADLDGDPREARIRRALSLTMAELADLHGDRIQTVHICEWSKRFRRVEARERRMLDALILEDRAWRDAPDEDIAQALVEGLRDLGMAALGWSKAAIRLRGRVEAARKSGADMPDMSDETLLETATDWLAPHLVGLRNAADLGRFDPFEALEALLTWPQSQALDRLYPKHFQAPTGTKAAIDYSDPGRPMISIRLQELFGLQTHPIIGPERVPLILNLLSPGHKPVQTTADLPGFWASSYADVRKDMRGRYPKHPWPEDPENAAPTRRAKPRQV